VSLNGILQKPGSSFTISGSTMTFASNLATGDVIDFVQILGNVLDIGQPSDDTVKTASIQANAVTGAKLNNDVISAQTALASEPADTDEFLVSDAGTLKRIDYSLIKGGGITQADQWRMNDTYGISGGTDTVINQYWEQVDDTGKGTIGSAMSQSSGIFTFPATGIYRIHCGFRIEAGATANYITCFIETTTDNSTYNQITEAYMSTSGGSAYQSGNSECLFDVDNTSNCKVRFVMRSAVNMTFGGNTNENHTYATFIRLGDT